MNDIVAIIVVFFVFKALGCMFKALFGGERDETISEETAKEQSHCGIILFVRTFL